ncbi:SRPBCC family protein [Massilia sp. Mn16-1_5]|uniref:SRPBCC family protein n=1 Tax=Massilia sp. Mn16-1_5 TaxID=2079199 RepID=UPI00109E99D1|nr:SRPBCC family protein [Massilia sp. Mn16-1_5]THC40012.1 cyclase/dehydrase [Massilia sp. Mn16-1_5]
MLDRIAHMLLLGYALLACSAGPAAAQPGAPRFELNVERVDSAEGDKLYRIASSGTVAATPAAVWRILTDYDHLADYLPNLESTRVLSRNGDKLIVEQLGSAQFLFFSQPIRLLVQVHERAPDRIDISLIDGDMKIYRASWELRPLAGASGTRVLYNATIVPKFDVPGIVGTDVVRKDVARMMAAVLLRLDRPG